MTLSSRLILRVLDANNQLLGWTEAHADVPGDGALWIREACPVLIDVTGDPAAVSVHWADVNVEVRIPLAAPRVVVGQLLNLGWPDAVIRIGPPAGGLPPVTVRRSVSLAVPVGGMGVQS